MKELRRFLELPGGLSVLVNRRNWVLDFGNKNERCYFPSLDLLLDEILEARLSMEAYQAKEVKSSVRDLIEVVAAAREATDNDIKRLAKAVQKADIKRKRGVLV